MKNPQLDRPLVDELTKFCREEAPTILPDLYHGLDKVSTEEVITDAMARVHQVFGLNKEHGKNKRVVHKVVGKKIEIVRKDLAFLLQILPICEKQAWKRRRQEIQHDYTSTPDGLHPGFIQLHRDKGQIPGTPPDNMDGEWIDDPQLG